MKKVTFIIITHVLVACSNYPEEKLIYYDNQNLKTKIITYNDKGKRDESNYSEEGQLISVYNYFNDNNGNYTSYYANGNIQEQFELKDGKYEGQAKRYYETGELKSLAQCKDNEIINSKSFDKKGVQYHEYLGQNRESLYVYSKDQKMMKITFIRKIGFDKSDSLRIIEDSIKYYDTDNQLRIKVVESDQLNLTFSYDDNQHLLKIDTVRNRGEINDIIIELFGKDPFFETYNYKF